MKKNKPIGFKYVTECKDLPEFFRRPPTEIFKDWMEEAKAKLAPEPTAFCLSTVNKKGSPDSRMLLLKEANATGFTFFTNYKSPKSLQLLSKKEAAMVFFWPTLARQVRVYGKIARVSAVESDRYFSTRPRGSQIGAWASEQSQNLSTRDELLRKTAVIEKRFSGKEVPRPPHWGGFVLDPLSLEFWIGQESRLHDRYFFKRDGKSHWKISRLSP